MILINYLWGNPIARTAKSWQRNRIMHDDIETEVSKMTQKLVAVIGAES